MSPHISAFGGDTYDRGPMPDYVVGTNNGFRCWELAYDANTLRGPSDPDVHTMSSLVQKYEWTEGLNVAGCLISASARLRREVNNEPMCKYPTKRCECGFYAYYDVDHWSNHPAWSAKYQRVDGIIEGYGRSVVGSKGFRSEFAVIVGLLIPSVHDISAAWRADRTPEEARDDVRAILQAKFPMTPLYETLDELLTAVPLSGKPDIVREVMGEPEADAS